MPLRHLTQASLLVTACFTAPAFAAADVYTIDPEHTSVIASWSHFGFSHPTATFSGADGTIHFDAQAPASSRISVTIPVETANTYSDKLNSEFMGEAYFHAEKYPTATFESTKVVPQADNTYQVHGTLTIKGISQPVIFHSTLNKRGTHPMTKNKAIGFDAKTEFKRSDFGLDEYVPDVGDTVSLQITTEAQVMPDK